MRRERPTFQPDLGELTVKTLQSRRKHLRVRVNNAPKDDLADFIDNAHRRPLATHVQSCKHAHRCYPFVIHESPAEA